MKPMLWVCLVDRPDGKDSTIRAWTTDPDRAEQLRGEGLDMQAMVRVDDPAQDADAYHRAAEILRRRAAVYASDLQNDLFNGGAVAMELRMNAGEIVAASRSPAAVEPAQDASGSPEGELVVTQYELAAARTALREIAGMNHNCISVDIAKAALENVPTAPQPGWLQPALEKAAERAGQMPDWMARRSPAATERPAPSNPINRSDARIVHDLMQTYQACGDEAFHTAAQRLQQLVSQVEDVVVRDQIIGAIEERFPNWKSYRDLIDCIDCTLHDLRKEAGR